MLRKYAQSSIDTYCSSLATLFSRCGFPLTIEPVKDYILTIKNVSTHKHLVATVRNYFSFVLGVKLSLSDLPYPRKQEKLIEVFSIEEVKQLFSVIHNLKHRAIVSLLYGCGLRISEVLNLKPSDIDSSRMIINIHQAKGNKDRQVMLDPKLLNLLREYFKAEQPTEYMFNGQYGNRYSESSVNQFLKYYARKAGIRKRIHAHLLRHCFAVHMIEAGNDTAILQRLLGHNNIKTTQHYAKISMALISKVQSPLSLIA